MTRISTEQAIDRARQQLEVDDEIPGRAWHVRWIDRPHDAYYLVEFGQDAAVAVAIVGVAKGDVRSSARLSGEGRHLAIDEQSAKTRAGVTNAESDQHVQAELVWQPGPASQSPLYPIWRVRAPHRTRYVDQQGRVWDELPLTGRGG